jgi:hypothetical protein
MFDRTKRHRSFLKRYGRFGIDATGVDCGGDYLSTIVLFEPRHTKRSVEAA